MSRGDRIAGVKPLTIVEEGTASFETMEDLVKESLTKHGDVLQRYHDVWYNAPHTWNYTHFLGVGMMKSPNDLWIYQALMNDFRPEVVIETGTYQGASALWFALLMDMLGIDGRVYTIDFEDHKRSDVVQHPRITFLHGDSTDPGVSATILEDIDNRQVNGELPVNRHCLVSLDADHSAEHVYRELNIYAPHCGVGDRLVVEDTNIAWSDGNGNAERGARGGLQDYIDEHPGEWRQDFTCERYLLTMNPGGWLERIAPYQEAR